MLSAFQLESGQKIRLETYLLTSIAPRTCSGARASPNEPQKNPVESEVSEHIGRRIESDLQRFRIDRSRGAAHAPGGTGVEKRTL